jgi:hypothetical protein
MELKIVKRPLQDDHTEPENIQYPGEKWCVKTSMYRETDGGMSLWFKEIERVNPEIVYLYSISSFRAKIGNGTNEGDPIENTIYSVRYEFKK